MKRLFNILAIVALVAFGTVAQAQKFGHLDFGKLYGMMPGQDSIQVAFQKYQGELQGTFEAMQGEYESKLMDYQNNLATMSAIIKQTKEKEIMDLQSRIEAFQSQAQQDMGAKQQSLTAPLIERARKAVESVAKEHGFAYIFNTAEGLVLYAQPSDDIMPLVKKKLNIK